MANLPDDWNEFLRLLGVHKVKFLVIGAHALAAHGRPRATLDLDLFVEPSTTNATRLAKALRDFGFEALAAQAAQLASGDRMASLGREPLRIDILNKIAGVSFARAWAGRVKIAFGSHTVAFLGRRELIANKLATGRTKDKLDIELLREATPRTRAKPVRKTRKR